MRISDVSSDVCSSDLELPGVMPQGIPAFGDTIGGMNIAGGIAAALLHRERTGKASEVDVSLMGTAAWAMASSLCLTMETGAQLRSPYPGSGAPPGQDPNSGVTGKSVVSKWRSR